VYFNKLKVVYSESAFKLSKAALLKGQGEFSCSVKTQQKFEAVLVTNKSLKLLSSEQGIEADCQRSF